MKSHNKMAQIRKWLKPVILTLILITGAMGLLNAGKVYAGTIIMALCLISLMIADRSAPAEKRM
jgi:hypothetical protein